MPQRRDYYPAEVVLPDGSMVIRGRVIIDPDGRARVYDAFQGQPRLRLDEQVTIVSEGAVAPYTGGARRTTLVAKVAAGLNDLRINSVGGCECGGVSILRRIAGEPVYSVRPR